MVLSSGGSLLWSLDTLVAGENGFVDTVRSDTLVAGENGIAESGLLLSAGEKPRASLARGLLSSAGEKFRVQGGSWRRYEVLSISALGLVRRPALFTVMICEDCRSRTDECDVSARSRA